ncbi:pasta domain protein [Treponema primitia ZAS-2]|uniref:Pasta domain protein n=1 Tax=Treponema primitia (strain ATCC BAA-887 / DSM 12427 / ZAS-2) TaxID=545694 RepID=F5YGU8_TREPZ|nr:PASTA domain-containing protein [Treponema primitia]AEF84124.1 pasta domain protein [Treponema primitia ZAS-2]
MGLRNRLKLNINLNSLERYVGNNLRFFISLSVGLIVFVGIIALAVFFIAVRGEEQTMVPDVRGKDLTQAILELQVKELYPRLQQRYSQSASERGLILEQSPSPGTIVKAGRRVRMVVSQGVIISNMENYVGRNIDEVRMDLQTLFASAGSAAGNITGAPPLISLKEPFMYQFSSETPGTILQQSPEPGTAISGPTILELVISRGPENEMITIPELTGLSIGEALELLGKSGLRFTFTQREGRGGEKPETVISQTPAAATIATNNIEVALVIIAPMDLKEGELFGLFSYTLPNNPYPLPVTLEAQLPSGERSPLITMNHPGGKFTVPYRLPAGTTLVLSMLNRELYREEISLPIETLFLDQL